MKRGFQARQGDVFIEAIPDRGVGKKVPREHGRVVLAHGEVTGHAHAIADRGAALYELPEDRGPEGDALVARVLQITSETHAKLRHEEHAAIAIPPGTYRVTRQREWTGEDERQVED